MTASATPIRSWLVVLPILVLFLLANGNHGGPDIAGHAQEQQRQQREDERRSLFVSLDPKTVGYKPSSPRPFEPFPLEKDDASRYLTFLAELKTIEPAIVRSRPSSTAAEGEREGGGREMTVDVVSIGSETRFDYMVAQSNTWAKYARNYFGFSESQDYDPACASSLEDYDVRMDYTATCRASHRGGSKFGIGHGGSGGWFCAQRRPTRALGWLQTLYGYSKHYQPEDYDATTATMSLPDVLIVVDDDTSVDIDRVTQIISENDTGGEPYVAAGSVFRLGKYGAFYAAHGGFGTYLNRAAIERLTRPINCNRRLHGDPFLVNACTKLRANVAGEYDLYRPGDSIFDVFYKLSSKPYFCMHSDWAMGYMITKYIAIAGVNFVGKEYRMDQVIPPGSRKVCNRESINCHYQTPQHMERFVLDHPQKQNDISLPPTQILLQAAEVDVNKRCPIKSKLTKPVFAVPTCSPEYIFGSVCFCE